MRERGDGGAPRLAEHEVDETKTREGEAEEERERMSMEGDR